MTDYTQVTKDGYTVEKLFLVEGNNSDSVILAVITRYNKRGNYFWVWDYHPNMGYWGQGHYDYDSYDSAVKGLKRAYPRAKSVIGHNLTQVVNEFGTFGEYADMTKALKRLYRITKTRGPTNLIRVWNGETIYSAITVGNRVRAFNLSKGRYCFINADGTVKSE